MNFHDLITSRQSIRSFKDKTPKRDVLEQILEAARMAPSAVNFQPWEFIVASSADMLPRVHACYHRDWINTAPVVVVAIGNHKEVWRRQADGKDHTDVDLSIAIDHLILQATELGLGSCWVCNFDVDKVKSLFDLPSYQEPIALIPMGYPEEDLKPVDKERKALDEIVKWV